MDQRYLTITGPTEAEYKDRGSRFIAFAFPVADETEVKTLLAKLRTEHPKARHVCHARVMGPDGSVHHANDDGEPGGSAGLPILNQIRSKGVTQVLVAVVRYFGGTKLGVPGLINAYKQSAKAALDAATVVEKELTVRWMLRFPHTAIGEVERVIRQQHIVVTAQAFNTDCLWEVEVPLVDGERMRSLFSALPQVLVADPAAIHGPT